MFYRAVLSYSVMIGTSKRIHLRDNPTHYLPLLSKDENMYYNGGQPGRVT